MIRAYRDEDGAAVVAICHATGYMGESAAGRFGDVELFGRLFVGAYLLGVASTAGFVAEVDGCGASRAFMPSV